MKLIVLFISVLFAAAPADISAVRQKYISASTSEQAAEELYTMLEGVNNDSGNTTMVAYKGAALTLRAKYAKGLLTKRDLFTDGAKLLEAVIAKDPDNYEARVIRLNIQEHAPRITGYHKEIDNDKAYLLKHYDEQNTALKEFTRNSVKISTSFSSEEKAVFNRR